MVERIVSLRESSCSVAYCARNEDFWRAGWVYLPAPILAMKSPKSHL